MLSVFDVVLQIFVDGAAGKKTVLDKEVNPDELLNLAKEHNIYYSVLEAMLISDIVSDEEHREAHKKTVKNIQLTSYFKHLKYAEILKVFENNNIPYALLKGYSVARYYKNPYTRLSGDTDVLINKVDEKKALKILKEYGFELVELSTSEMKHSVLNHPELGVMELHVALYNKKTQQLWFEDDGCKWQVDLAFSKLEKIPFDDMYYYTLPPDENIMFLFEHNVKHFISGGTSIRALMDFFLVYISDKKINHALFYDKVRKMNLEKLFHAMIATIERFMPFEGIDVPFYKNPGDEFVDAILQDMYDGKWLGYGGDGGNDVSRDLFEKKRRSDLNETEDKNFLKQLFPPVRQLQNNYKYSLRYPVLIPIAWTHRILRKIFVKPPTKSSEENENRRVSLFEKFDLL